MDLGEIRAQVKLDIRNAVAGYAALRAQNARTVYAMRGTGDAFVSSGRHMAVAGAAMVGVFALAVKKAADFERKMDFFQAVTGTSAGQMKKLDDVTLQLAQDTIYSADEMANGMVELGKAGVSAQEIIGGIGKAMANLGAAGDIPLAQAGQIITSTLRQFDLGASKAVQVTDLLAGAANASIADITDIGVSLKYVGGVANATGASLDDTVTAISLLAKAGIRGSTAGTSLRQMLVSLPGVTAPAYAQLKDLGIITEDNKNRFYDLHGNLKPLPKVFQMLHNSMQGMTKEQKLVALRTIFNNRALAAAAILTRDGAKGFRQMNADMKKTTAAETARKRLDNLSGDIEILRGNIETLLTKAGGPFQETLRGWVQSLTKLVQAFTNLPAGTQKAILQFIAISGVILTVMGVITMIIGFIFRFVTAIIRLYQAVSFVLKVFRVLLWLFGIITGGAISATFLAIAAVVLLLAGAFIIAYKKSETFRNFINGIGKAIWTAVKAIGSAIMAVLKWFKLLATNPKKAWDQLKAAASQAVSWLGAQFAKLPGLIGQGLQALVGIVGSLIGRVVSFFLSLPGRILAGIGKLIPMIGGAFAKLPGAVMFAIGFLIVQAPAMFIRMGILILSTVGRMIGMMISLFATLAPKVGYFIGFMIGRTIRLFIQLGVRAVSLIVRMVTSIISWVGKLPGRIAGFIGRMVTRGIALVGNIARAAPRLIVRMVSGMVSAVASLPGRIAGFVSSMASRVRSLVSKLPGFMVRMGHSMLNGLRAGISNIPGMVSGFLNSAISAIRGKVTEAFNAVKGFAAGMWNGFKKGLFGSPRTKIEYAMEDMTATVGRETDRLKRQTLQVQKLSLKMARTQFGVGDLTGKRAGAGSLIAAKKLASAQVATTARGPVRPTINTTVNTPRLHQMSGTMRLTPDSRVLIAGIAQDVVDDNAEYDNVLEGM